MAERSEAVEERSVRDASAAYSVEVEVTASDDVPPEYKRTEVGVIPKDWQEQKIGALAQIKRGASPRPIADSKWFDTKSEIGWLRISDVAREGKFIRATDQTLSDAGVARSRLVRPGNVVMSMAATVGRPAINRKTVCIHDGFVVFEKAAVSSEFLYYLLLAIEDGWAERGQTGSQINLNTHIIGSTLVLLPATEAEQRAIATALSDADALIETLDRLIAKKRAIKQAAMQQLLTGQTRLPGFTGEWDTKRLGDLSTIRVGVSKARYITPGGQFLIVDMGSISRSGQLIASKPTSYKDDILAEGELVMPKDDIGGGGIIGKVAYIDSNNRYVLGDHVYALRIKEEDSRFLSYLINSHAVNSELKSKVSGSAQLGLARKAVLEQRISRPELEEQRAIASVLSDMDTEIEALEHRRDKARRIKQGMMQQLLTGRVRLVAPDNSEPAAC